MDRRELIEKLIVAVQCFRSMNAEEIPQQYQGISADLMPWSLGEKCILPALLQIASKDSIPAMDVFNMLVIAHRLAPEIATAYAIVHDETLPEPALSDWIK